MQMFARRRSVCDNRYLETLGEVLDVVQQCFDRWLKTNSVLQRLCGIICDAMFSVQ
jgi:hypothetical protein